MPHNPLVDFKHIDRTRDSAFFIRFLDTASAQPSFQAYKRRTFELLRLRAGQAILDVACGTGDDSRELAKQVGRVVAIDLSQAMIAEARQRSVGVNLPVEFQVADAQQLPYADNTFDGCRCDRSFMHIPDPKRALLEMRRVTKPGGRVVVYEVDFGTVTIDAPDRPLARQVANAWSDGFRNGWLGRYIPSLFQEVGFADIVIEPAVLQLNAPLVSDVFGPGTVNRAVETGTISADAGRHWLIYLNEALSSGRCFSTLTGFLVVGTKV